MNTSIVSGRVLSGDAGGAPAGTIVSSTPFGDLLSAALENASSAIAGADARAAAVAAGAGSVADASIARAKADAALEIVSVTASRVSGAVNALLQTQV